jgi:hypothetical protein
MRRACNCVRVGVAGFLAAFLVTLPPSAAAQPSELDGAWMQLSAVRPPVELTPAGKAAVADYVPLRDDPDLQCKPGSLTNVIGIPDPPWEIRLHDGYVEINFEYMDVKRRVPLGSELTLDDAPYTVADYPHLGRSIGRYDGDTLVIETFDSEAGFLETRGEAEGYPQSTQMRMEERYRADGDSLFVDITHTDPVNYLDSFTMSFEFFRVDFEILEFGCTIDAASYDDRL